jgi:hypothetical protein
MREIGLFSAVSDEVGQIIVADVDAATVRDLVAGDSAAREELITRGR